jgi:mannose-1-phosphate guanylyltransferase
MNILILAGGSGTRLWPASRQKKPKQLLPFLGNKTLLQNTYERFLKLAEPKNIYVGTLSSYGTSIKKQLPRVPAKNYSLEPALRDRGPAIGLAALIMNHHNSQSTFVTAWSDHYIKEESRYLQMLKKADAYLKNHPQTTITVGVKPRFAHPGLGYIEQGRKIPNKLGLQMYEVKSFREKPSAAIAKKYVSSGRYLWNAAYFAWRTDYLLDLYRRHLPEIYALLMKIKPALGTPRQQAAINKYYPLMPKVDIEKGLIEKINQRVVIAADFTWADIGSWRVIKEILSSADKNLVQGLWAGADTENTLIYNYTDKLVATVGIKNSIVVATEDIILVADKNDPDQIRKLIKILENTPKLRKYL